MEEASFDLQSVIMNGTMVDDVNQINSTKKIQIFT